jgi:KDO2-lipid IV(A) lauroyltransferase
MNALKAMLLKVGLRLCSMLPLELARALGRGVGHAYWFWGGRSRRVTEINISVAFPDMSPGKQRALARHSVCSTGELVAEMGHIWLRPWGHIGGLIKEVQGAGVVSDALDSGRGVIVLVPHLGNWEVLGLHLATLGSTVSLYEPPKLPGLGPFIEQARQRSGARLVPTDRRGLASLIRSVRHGGIAGILPDQTPNDVKSGQNTLFMGVPCFTGTLASNMIRRTGALAVFGFAQRVPGGFVLRYELAQDGIYDEDTALSLAALNRGIEACLSHCVPQYQWEYKRFRQRPRKGPGLYRDL